MTSQHTLARRLHAVARRCLLVGGFSGAIWALIASIGLLLLAAWLDLVWELSAEARAGAWILALVGALAMLAVLLVGSLRAARAARVARRLDAVGGSGGVILTGWELCRPLHAAYQSHAAEVSAGLAQLAVDRAAGVAEKADAVAAVPLRPAGRALSVLAGMVVVIGVAALAMPTLVQTEWLRLLHPWADVPPYSPLEIRVAPGDASVIYGSALEIRATVEGRPIESAELVWEESGKRAEGLPMFAEPDGRWRAAVEKVTERATYYVRAERARSSRYQVSVITVPRILGVRVKIVPPAYTRLAPVDGPVPKDGIAGLRGTAVEIRATSNRPLRGGKLTLTGPGGSEEVRLRSAAEGASEAIGQFSISRSGRFLLGVEDVSGQASQDTVSGSVVLLADQRPLARLIKPPPAALATPTAALPVVVAAEDDYGLSRVELFRSLNESRASPAALAIEQRNSRRLFETTVLPLARYGLEPGDVIKLFARAEDNDPAGVKGSESPLATVRIISQEEFERLLRTERGLEVMRSKYAEARRRMEAVAKDLERLKGALDKLAKNDPADEKTRQQLTELAKRLASEAQAIAQLAAKSLPYDLDERLTPELQEAAKALQKAEQEIRRLAGEKELSNQRAAQKLAELARQLGMDREAFEKKALVPMDLLAAVFPLLVDQRRFVALALHQQDLAERLASLRGREGEDDPAIKGRMRDLEEEQQRLGLELDELLSDIERHATQLPDKPELDKLRTTAIALADKVRKSGAADAMRAAESSLAEFKPTHAGEKAREAAQILRSFIKECEDVGDRTSDCMSLIFQPSLSQSLGRTMSQLLAGMGLGGIGMGDGGMGGYSMPRGSTVGLFGSMMGMEGLEGHGDRDAGRNVLSAGQRGDGRGEANPDQTSQADTPAPPGSGGSGEGQVPLEYRRRVGLYFQRIADEAGQR